jgi:protein arginine kinase activator
MKCDKCAKKATVHLTEIVDGKAMELHLCEDCAREQSQVMEQQFGLADLLAGLTDFGKQIPEVRKSSVSCPVCGLSYEDFRKFGRFGCAHCYQAFQAQLKVLLKKIHGSSVHLGKHPQGDGLMAVTGKPSDSGPSADPVAGEEPNELESLRARLQEAIRNEDFEQAVQLRDRIRELEQNG